MRSGRGSSAAKTEYGNESHVVPGRHGFNKRTYGRHSRPVTDRAALLQTVSSRAAAVGVAGVVAGGSAVAAGTGITGLDDSPTPASHSEQAEDIVDEALEASLATDFALLPPEEDEEGDAEDEGAAEEEDAEKEEKPAEPTVEELREVDYSASEVFGLNKTQLRNAELIVEAGREAGMGERAWAVALSTAMQESNLYNYANPAVPESYDYGYQREGRDYDSVGLFQQRASQNWGSVEELMDPKKSAKLFYERLRDVSGWEHMSVTAAAQTVQVSAFPDAYAKWEGMAWDAIGVLG
ncbi:hypothetical protein [Salininema proteolyticum]|uniref:Peptidase M23 n=1 Tax=Salininema proteolyticum TaxID=1607685 RepID=A0ABV8TZY3_9ACTN